MALNQRIACRRWKRWHSSRCTQRVGSDNKGQPSFSDDTDPASSSEVRRPKTRVSCWQRPKKGCPGVLTMRGFLGPSARRQFSFPVSVPPAGRPHLRDVISSCSLLFLAKHYNQGLRDQRQQGSRDGRRLGCGGKGNQALYIQDLIKPEGWARILTHPRLDLTSLI